MTKQPSVLKCRACEKECTVDLPIGVELGAFVKYVRTVKCPNCGAGYGMLDMVRTPA